LTFEKDDLIRVIGATPSGWWYGTLASNFNDLDEDKNTRAGFFPSNYTTQLISGDKHYQKQVQAERELEVEKYKQEMIERNKAKPPAPTTSYLDYATETFANKEQLLISHRRDKALETVQPLEDLETQHTKEILSAYRKFGIDNANPTKSILRKLGEKYKDYQAKPVLFIFANSRNRWRTRRGLQ